MELAYNKHELDFKLQQYCTYKVNQQNANTWMGLGDVSMNLKEYKFSLIFLIKEWLNENDMFNLIDDIFDGESVNEKEFKKTLNKLLSNIAEIRKTPMEQREYEDWN